MSNLQLSLAINDYDHVRDLATGKVRVEGIDLTVSTLPVEEIFHRFVRFREWDLSEMSFGKIVSLAAQDTRDLVAIPVFPSRAFRHSSIYVRKGAGIGRVADLAGKRVGVPEWAQTASIYTRGMLAHEYGVDLKSIHWYQGGVNEAGRKEKVQLYLPEGMRYTPIADRSLSEMLLASELDAILSARPPRPFSQGDARIGRLFEDYRPLELDYWKRTGIFPIMHVIAIRRDVYERNVWIAMNLFHAFEEAKNRSLVRAADITASAYPLPWIADYVAQSTALLGSDFWPYGIDANRITLEAFVEYAWEQGVCRRRLSVDEIFAPEVQSRVRV